MEQNCYFQYIWRVFFPLLPFLFYCWLEEPLTRIGKDFLKALNSRFMALLYKHTELFFFCLLKNPALSLFQLFLDLLSVTKCRWAAIFLSISLRFRHIFFTKKEYVVSYDHCLDSPSLILFSFSSGHFAGQLRRDIGVFGSASRYRVQLEDDISISMKLCRSETLSCPKFPGEKTALMYNLMKDRGPKPDEAMAP